MNDEKEKILVVDDDSSLLFLLSKTLKKSGYTVETAPDGLQGLRILQDSSPFSVLVTDLMMPEMGGLELLSRARENDEYLEVIVITAAGSIETAIIAMRDGGAYDYLLKPFESMKEVSVIVGRAIAHRHLVMDRIALQRKTETDARRLQALIANVGDAIMAASADNVITVANPVALRILGREDLVGQQVAAVLPPDLVAVVENWRAITDNYPASLEIRWQDQGTYLVNLAPLPDSVDERQGWAMVLRDVTALKRLDHIKTQALVDTISRIRMPMAEAMSAVVDLNLRAAQDERLAESLFRLTTVWKRIQAWGDDLLTVIHRDDERGAQWTNVDLNVVLDSIQDEGLVTMYRRGGGRLDVQAEGSLPSLHTDSNMLQQVLRDLLKRAMARSLQDGEVRLLARAYGEKVWVEVSDSGPLATDADLLAVADLAPTLSSVGMELVRAKVLLDRLGGDLWIGGRAARGSTIIIGLPALPTSE